MVHFYSPAFVLFAKHQNSLQWIYIISTTNGGQNTHYKEWETKANCLPSNIPRGS